MKILAHYAISPPPNSPPPPSLPLTFLDIPWLFFSPSQPLFFYDYPHPTSHFISTTLPTLKHSLSLTLRHFPHFAGNLVLSSTSSKPIIAINNSDIVSLTVAESNHNFSNLSGNHQRRIDQFHPLVPDLPSKAPKEGNAIPLFSVKITIFPNHGICIGLSYHHVLADARTFNHFIKTWASLHRDNALSSSIHPPNYDRTMIKDVNELEPIFLKKWSVSTNGLTIFGKAKLSMSEVRATFVFCPNAIEKIKNWIMGQCKEKDKPQPTHLSPYNVICSLTWVCLMKAQAKVGSRFSGQDPSYFGFNAGGITRLGYPDSYFGNCVGFARCLGSRSELLGEDGIVIAANLIGSKIKEVNNAMLGRAEKWISDWEVFSGSDPGNVMVVGSPKVDFYETDFGWGRPKKIEDISIDGGNAISLVESRDFMGGIEVGLALSKAKMDAFASEFNQFLSELME